MQSNTLPHMSMKTMIYAIISYNAHFMRLSRKRLILFMYAAAPQVMSK